MMGIYILVVDGIAFSRGLNTSTYMVHQVCSIFHEHTSPHTNILSVCGENI